MKAYLPVGIVLFVLVTAAGAAPTATAPAVPESPAAVRVVVEVIEATVDQKVLPQLDFQSIDPARHRVDKLLDALGKHGSASLTIRFDNQVTPGNEVSLQSGQRMPFVTGSNISPNTKNVSHTIQYQDVGAVCQFRFSREAGSSFPVAGSIEWSGVVATGVKISENVTAPSFLKTNMRFSSKLQPDTPVLMSMVSNLPDQSDGSKKAQAVLFRITANPRPPTPRSCASRP